MESYVGLCFTTNEVSEVAAQRHILASHLLARDQGRASIRLCQTPAPLSSSSPSWTHSNYNLLTLTFSVRSPACYRTDLACTAPSHPRFRPRSESIPAACFIQWSRPPSMLHRYDTSSILRDLPQTHPRPRSVLAFYSIQQNPCP
jgi:hypothetical protein